MSAASNAATGAHGEQKLLQRSLAVGIGNFMEWFDFAVYGFFAVVIGQEFFKGDSPAVGVLSALAVFAVGFFMRPLGGFILGPIGDRFGRRTSLMISIIAMGVSTGLVGFIPNYATIGVLAPVLLVVLRCVQGLSAGGEWTGSASFLLESAPSHRRGLYASIISGTAALATLVGSGFALLLNSVLPADDLVSFGWRIPFWCAIPIAAVGLFLRLRLNETPVFAEVAQRRADADAAANAVVKSAAKRSVKPVLLTIAFSSVEGLGYYYLGTYVSNYLQVSVKLVPTKALLLAGIGIFLYMCMTPFAGMLSDRIGRRLPNLIGTFGFIVLTIPAFLMMGTGNPFLVVFGLVLFGICLSLTNVTTTVMLVELFPASTRMSGSSIGFNIALAFVAGPGPYIGAFLAAAFDSSVAPAFYIVGVAVLASIVLVIWLPESRLQDISSDEVDYSKKIGAVPIETPSERTSGTAAPTSASARKAH